MSQHLWQMHCKGYTCSLPVLVFNPLYTDDHCSGHDTVSMFFTEFSTTNNPMRYNSLKVVWCMDDTMTCLRVCFGRMFIHSAKDARLYTKQSQHRLLDVCKSDKDPTLCRALGSLTLGVQSLHRPMKWRYRPIWICEIARAHIPT